MSITIVQKGDLASIDFANSGTNNAGGVSIKTDGSSNVGIAIAAAIAAAPADHYISSLAAYNSTTNIATFNLANGGTTTADFTTIVADAVASVPTATTSTTGTVTQATAAQVTAGVSTSTVVSPADLTAKLSVVIYANDGTTVLGHVAS
jgi:hypothetical protein